MTSLLKSVFGRKEALCLDYIRDPIAIFDRDGRLSDLNGPMAALLKAPRNKLLGKKPSDLAVKPIRNLLAESMEKAPAGFSGELKIGDGVYSASLYPLHEDGTNSRALLLHEITGFRNLEDELVKRNRLLMAINTISTAFIYSEDISSVFSRLIDKIMLVTDLGICWIAVREGDRFELRGASGISRDFREKLEKGGLDYIYRRVIESEEPFVVYEGREAEAVEDLGRERIEFLTAQALYMGPDRIGVLAVGSRTPVVLDFELASLIHLIGNHVSLVLEKVKLYENAEYLAITDALTGLFNLRYFYDSLSHETARARRYQDQFSLTIFDIDDFKEINDRYGHQAGDEVLRGVASVMKRVSRESDIVARYGGEEFVIILANTAKDEALKQALRVKNAVETESYLKDNIRISISGGVASFPEDGADEKRLLYMADMALYEAKSMGKRQVRMAGRKK